jgi:hypothetical protein
VRIVLVPGTWSAYRGDDAAEWWFHHSPFVQQILTPLGFRSYVHPWTTRVNGGPRWPWQWWTRRHYPDWESAGDALAHYLRVIHPDDRILIAHSHGGAVACRALSQVSARLLITVSSPVRADLEEWYQGTQRNVGKWFHVHSDADRMFRWGSYFDGKFDLLAKDKSQPYASENIYAPKRGHSSVLRDPAAFIFWRESGLLGHLADCKTLPPKDCEGLL